MKSCLQTGCLVLGILCLLYFIVITAYAGLHTSLSWLWIFGGAWFLLLWRLLLCLDRRPSAPLRAGAGLMLFLACAGLLVIALIGRGVAAGMHAQPQAGLDYVIVLGAQVRGTVPSRALRIRLDRAAKYAQENPGTLLILSGGQGPDEEISEAECMYRYLARQGIPEERLLLEDRSESTEQNLRFSAEYFDRTKARTGVLTNSFHICRALMLARHLGYADVCGIPAPSDPLMQPHNVLREICALLAEGLKGRGFR